MKKKRSEMNRLRIEKQSLLYFSTDDESLGKFKEVFFTKKDFFYYIKFAGVKLTFREIILNETSLLCC